MQSFRRGDRQIVKRKRDIYERSEDLARRGQGPQEPAVKLIGPAGAIKVIDPNRLPEEVAVPGREEDLAAGEDDPVPQLKAVPLRNRKRADHEQRGTALKQAILDINRYRHS